LVRLLGCDPTFPKALDHRGGAGEGSLEEKLPAAKPQVRKQAVRGARSATLLGHPVFS